MSGRVERDVERPGERITFTFDGEAVEAVPGETVAMALWAAGRKAVRRSSRRGVPRAPFCCMGICFECLVRLEGRIVRACTTPVREGMQVETGGSPGDAGRGGRE